MSDYRLRIGMKFRQQGRLYVIEQALPNDYLGIKDILSGKIRTITRGELLAGLVDGELELVSNLDQNDAKSGRLADLRVTDLNLHADEDPLERVECDHPMLDLMVVDTETRLPLGRPWLTAMLDIHSRMVLGIYLSVNPPQIRNDWLAYGRPELLAVDNGRGFCGRPKPSKEEGYV